MATGLARACAPAASAPQAVPDHLGPLPQMLGRGLDVAPGMGERGQIEMRAARFVARAERSEGLKGGTRMGGGLGVGTAGASLALMAPLVPPGFAPYDHQFWRFSTAYLAALAGFVCLGRAAVDDAGGAVHDRRAHRRP